MPFTLPQLDDRSYADLMAEARALIPAVYPEWTDHNPADPGITLIELFCWLIEMLIFRADQIPDRHRLVFLRLLNGADPAASLVAGAGLDAATRDAILAMLYAPTQAGPPAPELVDEAVRVTVVGLGRRDRAVTGADFEALALAASPAVARARCVPRRYLDAASDAERRRPRPECVSIVVLPRLFTLSPRALERLARDGLPRPVLDALAPRSGETLLGDEAFARRLLELLGPAAGVAHREQIMARALAPAPQPDAALRDEVWRALEPRRLLTTRHYVVGPFYAPVSAEILVARRADADDRQVREAVVAALEDFFHALRGGPDGAGWPFGRAVYLSELYELLESVPGVDYVPDILLASTCPAGLERCAPAAELWHDTGEQIGLELDAAALPLARVAVAGVVTGVRFATLRVLARVLPHDGADPAVVRRAVRAAIRRGLHPLHGGPNGQDRRTITVQGLRTRVRALTELVSGIEAIVLEAEPSRLVLSAGGTVTGVQIEARELVDGRVQVEIGD